MVWSHLILQILYIAIFCNNRIISPECIYSPTHITISRPGYWIPPRVYFFCSRIFLSPYIMPTFWFTGIKPSPLHRMKANFPIIGFWTSQIDRMMSTIDISSPENTVSKETKRVHICRKFSIKNQFSRPGFLRFSSIWEINTKNIHNLPRNLMCECHMSNSSFICYRISWKTRKKWNRICFKKWWMNPGSCSRISSFFSRIIIRNIWIWWVQICRKLIWSSLNFLHKNNIWTIHSNKILYFRFFFDGSESVHIPRDNFHRYYSTVTDLARFRGLSTSRPREFAIWYAKSWSITTSRNGLSSDMSGSNSITSA